MISCPPLMCHATSISHSSRLWALHVGVEKAGIKSPFALWKDWPWFCSQYLQHPEKSFCGAIRKAVSRFKEIMAHWLHIGNHKPTEFTLVCATCLWFVLGALQFSYPGSFGSWMINDTPQKGFTLVAWVLAHWACSRELCKGRQVHLRGQANIWAKKTGLPLHSSRRWGSWD